MVNNDDLIITFEITSKEHFGDTNLTNSSDCGDSDCSDLYILKDSICWDLPYQLSCGCFLIAYLLPYSNLPGQIGHHVGLALGHLLLAVWSWDIFCSPPIIVIWHLILIIMNIVQIIFIFYTIRVVKFEPDLEQVFVKMFQPMKINRTQFRKLVASNAAKIITLHPGECYAVSNITSTDKLGLLVTGKCSVFGEDQILLHEVGVREFLDSPEYESSTGGHTDNEPDIFRVTICAVIPSRYIVWQRTDLEMIFLKDSGLAAVTSALVARDVLHKLNKFLDQRLGKTGRQSGDLLDIRNLPAVDMKGHASNRYKEVH